MNVDRPLERAGAVVHAFHGTRGLALGGVLLLLTAATEPLLPPTFPRVVYAVPLGILLFNGLATLPREGLAAHERARRLVDEPDAVGRMLRRALWGGGLCLALVPNLFLASQGVPHLNPLVGLLLPSAVRTLALVALLAVLLLAIQYLRTSRGYAPSITPLRPREVREGSGRNRRREWIQVFLWAVIVLWAWMLQEYWRPFSLLEWHDRHLSGSLESFRSGARGLAGLAFTVVPPALLFVTASAHVELLREVHRRGAWLRRPNVAGLAAVHVALALLALLLHAYNLFWITRYRTLGFL